MSKVIRFLGEDDRGYDHYRLGRFMVAHESIGGTWDIVDNAGRKLGRIAWQSRWKTKVFQPATVTEFSGDCLAALVEFLTLLNSTSQKAQDGKSAAPGPTP